MVVGNNVNGLLKTTTCGLSGSPGIPLSFKEFPSMVMCSP